MTLQTRAPENFRWCRWGAERRVACPYPEARTPIGASGNLYAFLLSTPYNVYISIFRLNDTKIHRQKQNGLDYLGQLDTDFNTFSKHSFAGKYTDSYCVRISIFLELITNTIYHPICWPISKFVMGQYFSAFKGQDTVI